MKCKICNKEIGQIGGNLEAHHIKKFSILLAEFLSFYNQFSPIEDKETLVRLAISYEPNKIPKKSKFLKILKKE
jgi:hypothetical protein